MFSSRATVVRIGIGCALAVAVGLLIAFGIAPKSSKASQWRVYPGPRPVAAVDAQRCLATSASLNVTRTAASTMVVEFANDATLRLRFLRSDGAAERLTPWTFAPAVPRSSVNNVVITRPRRSTEPPPMASRVFGRCLLAA